MNDGSIEVEIRLKENAEAARAAGERMGKNVEEGVNKGMSKEEASRLASAMRRPLTEWPEDEARKKRRERIERLADMEREWDRRRKIVEEERIRKIIEPVPPPLPKKPKPATFTGAGLSALSATGIPYLSTMVRAIFSPVGAAAAGVSLAFMALRMTVDRVNQAMAEARRNYAATLRSGGLPLGYVTQRRNLAEIIGVGEEDVWSYGGAVKYVSEMTAVATASLARNAKELTAGKWAADALSLSFRGLWAEFATAFVPLSVRVKDGLRTIVDGFTELLGRINEWRKSYPAVGQAIERSMATMLPAGLNWIYAFGKHRGSAPEPTVGYHRLPGSHLERVGLGIAIGTGGPLPEKQTAENTRKMVNLLEIAVEVLRATSPALRFAIQRTNNSQ